MAAIYGGDNDVDVRTRFTPDLGQLRTLQAGKSLDLEANGEFFVILAPGDKSAKVDAVQFVSGSDQLRSFGDRLRSLDYGPVFPDNSPARIVRRGVLSCSKVTGVCIFVLILPEDVRTVN